MTLLRSSDPGLRRTTILVLAVVMALFVLAVALVGCGGGSSSSGSSVRSVGRATIKITWPASTAKLIPVASNSIVVKFLSGTSVVGTQTASKPATGNTSTLTFTSLPAGSLTLVSTAYPTTDGTTTSSPTAQATASQTVTITSGQTASLAITMAEQLFKQAPSPPAKGGLIELDPHFVKGKPLSVRA